MAGALAALNRVTGWDPREADCLVGTSAGAVFAALLAAGESPERLLPPGRNVKQTDLTDLRIIILRALNKAA